MAKVLITGAGGYIGSVATKLFVERGFEVVALDNFSTGYKDPLKLLQEKFGSKKLRYYQFDLRDDLTTLFKKEKGIKAAVHYAACCSVDESMADPQKYFSNNVCGSLNLLKYMLDFGVGKIVFSSTCAVYGEAKYMPVDENHPKEPKNPYGQSKLMVEKTIGWYGELRNVKYVILRYFNVCGALDDGLIGDSKKPSSLLVQNAVRGALDIEPFFMTCPKVNTKDGTPIRDYVNVLDLNDAHVKALDYLMSGGESQVINLGTGKGNSVLDIIKYVQKETGVEFSIKSTNPRKGEYSVMIASNRLAKKILGWSPKHTLQDSIKSLVLWYKRHPQGWKN